MQLVAMAGGIVLLIVVLTALIAVYTGSGNRAADERQRVLEEKTTNSAVVGMDVLPLR